MQILFLGLLIVIKVNSFALYHSKSYTKWNNQHQSLLMSSNDDDSAKKTSKPQKSTKFDRVVDDFMSKRYGNGEFFYGKRTSDMTEEEYTEKTGGPKVRDEDAPLRDNAILIVGGIDTMAQWVAFDLAEKGFNIRISGETMKEVTEWFGLPGNNVDIVPLTPTSSEESYARAIQGVQAIVFSGNFDPKVSLGPLLDPCRRYLTVASRLIDMADRAKTAGVGEVQKIVQISRQTPWKGDSSSSWTSLVGSSQTSPFQSLFDAVSGITDSTPYDDFRALHGELEKRVRVSGFDYVIVRAPPNVMLTRRGAKYELMAIQSPSDIPANAVQYVKSEVGDGQLALSIGQLDLGEATVQALLSSRSGFTVLVCEDPSDPILVARRQQNKLSLPFLSDESEGGLPDDEASNGSDPLEISSLRRRPARNAYYGILSMSDEDMKTSYIIRPEESYLTQLTEDEQVEQYWASVFKALRTDS
eukprot:gene441-790_t